MKVKGLGVCGKDLKGIYLWCFFFFMLMILVVMLGFMISGKIRE